jgi:translation initiation factor 2 beta subunit (eIF-2beta)/eIF-5
LRIAILAGVSTDAQVKDKLSIPEQIKHCRAYLKANNATESAGPYIMDGYSRTGYDSLEVAMREIPPLGLAIQQSDQYDVLLMDNFDRLGDLGYIVKTRFKKLHKQLHSVRQSGKLVPPELYDPYNDDSGDISMHVEGIIQTYRINKIRRGWNIGVPNRARNGLPSMNFPYAYKLSAKNEPPTLIKERGALVVKMKNKFLAGEPLTSIEKFAQASGIPPARGTRWHATIIARMLANPFYAGQTIYGRTKRIDGKKSPVPQSQWIIGQGKHTPLWDTATHHAILAEFERRNGRRVRNSYHALTSLVRCHTCGQTIHHHGQNKRWHYLGCKAKGHRIYPYHTAFEWIAAEVAAGLKKQSISPAKVINNANAIKQLQARRIKVQEGFENNVYTAAEASARLAEIEKEMFKLETAQQKQQQQNQNRSVILQFANTDQTALKKFILESDPSQINHLLRTLIDHITITPQNKVIIEWK